ncbi:hypothetical protein ACGFJ7_40765 [Actinoplanes sp. NPDC048988]|uniref:hypothetical protein n=1 Tax=Actinoplanes sp. NPDC048988 TaxID=3363901 RepID=UPI0037179055
MWVRDGPLVSCFSANGRSGCPATVTPRLPPPAAGRASLRDVDWSGSGRGRYALASGQVGSGVTGVDVVLPDGRSVQATVGNGWWAAWWPGEETADVRIVAR